MTSLSLAFSPVFLKNPVSCHLFSNFLESEFNHENLLFWLTVEKYKHINEPTKLPAVAKEIFETYIAEGSEYSVNLGFTVVQSLEQNIEKLEALLAAAPPQTIAVTITHSPSSPSLSPSSPSVSSPSPISEIDKNSLSDSTSSTVSTVPNSPTVSTLSNSFNSFLSDSSDSSSSQPNDVPLQTSPPAESTPESIITPEVSLKDKGDVYQQFYELFNEAQDHIFHLMKTDPYPRFLKSEYYAQLLSFRPGLDAFKTRHPLDDMVTEGFLQAAESQEGWEENREQDGVIVSKKRSADIFSMRGIGIVDAEPRLLFSLINMNKRKEWDDLFCEGQEIERLNDSMIVYYMAWKSPSKLTFNRDFVMLRVVHENKEDGSFMCVAKSVSHPNVLNRQGFVRAEMESSGFIIRPCGPNQSFVIYPERKIPKAVESYICQHRPLCILQLRKLVSEQKRLDASKENWHNASLAAANRKKLNRSSVYVPNTKIFNATGTSWNAGAVEEINPDRSSKEFDFLRIESPPKNTFIPLSSSPVFIKSHTSPKTKIANNPFLFNNRSSPNSDYRLKLNQHINADGGGSSSESGSPLFTKGKINKLDNSALDSPPESPTATKVRLNFFDISRTKANRSPSSSLSSSPVPTPPLTPPLTHAGDNDDSSKGVAGAGEEPPKKKGSKLNLFNNVSKMSSSPSTSDDEKHNSLWQRATKHFQPVAKQGEGQ